MPTSPLIIAHRGESHDAPENTLAAFHLAWQRGVKAIELDIHLTRDHQIIVCHDKDTERITTPRTKHIIADTTAADLQKLDVGSGKDSKYKNEKIPLLAEVFFAAPQGSHIVIELKPEDPRLVDILIDLLKTHGRTAADTTIISFHAAHLAVFKRLNPAGPRTALLSSFKQHPTTQHWSPTTQELIADARACHADGLSLANKPPVNQAMIAAIHAANLTCAIWTEDNPTAAKQYIDWNIDALTTNRAHWLTQQLKNIP